MHHKNNYFIFYKLDNKTQVSAIVNNHNELNDEIRTFLANSDAEPRSRNKVFQLLSLLDTLNKDHIELAGSNSVMKIKKTNKKFVFQESF